MEPSACAMSSVIGDFGLRASLPNFGAKKHSTGQNSCSDGGTLGGTTTSSEDTQSVATTERGGPEDPETSTLEPDDDNASTVTPTVRSHNGVLRMNIKPVVDDVTVTSTDDDSTMRKSKVCISEIREQTLAGYSSPRTPQGPLPLVASYGPPEESDCRKDVENDPPAVALAAKAMMKSLSTQTGGSLGYSSRPKELKPSIILPPVSTSPTASTPCSPGSAGVRTQVAFPGSNLPQNQSMSAINLTNSHMVEHIPPFMEPPHYQDAIRRKSIVAPTYNGPSGPRASDVAGHRWPSVADSLSAQNLDLLFSKIIPRISDLQQANSEPGLSSGFHESIGGMVTMAPPAGFANLPGPSYVPGRVPVQQPHVPCNCGRCLGAAQRSRSSTWLNRLPPPEPDINTYLAAQAFRQLMCSTQYPPRVPSTPHYSPQGQAGPRRSSPNGGAAHMILRNQSDSPRKRSGRIVRTQSVNAADQQSQMLRQRHDQVIFHDFCKECTMVSSDLRSFSHVFVLAKRNG